jgi:pre-mRNA-splicing factor SPF27
MAPLDTSRYRLDTPEGTKRHDFGAWKASVDNAYSQLEHQYLRITNLELMLKYGDKVGNWGSSEGGGGGGEARVVATAW